MLYEDTTGFGNDFGANFHENFIEKNEKIDALARAWVQFFENRCFHYFTDFHLQKPGKRGKKSSILGRGRLENPFKKRLEMFFVFLDDFWWILGRFRTGLGGLFGDLRRFWGVQGVSWRRLRDVFSTGWPPEGPRERFYRIWGLFWEGWGLILRGFGVNFERFGGALRVKAQS